MIMWSLERKIVLSACLVLMVAIGLGTLAWRSSVRADEASDWVEHSYKVLSDIEAGQRAQDQIMTNLQGYLLTGDRAHLLRRDEVWAQWQVILGNLKSLTADNPRQQERLHEVQKSLDVRMAASRGIEDAYLHGRAAEVARVVADGALVSDKLDKVLHEMRRDEHQLLTEHKAVELGRSQSTRFVLITLLTIITAFPLFTLLLLRREYLLRQAAEAERTTLTNIIEATPDILTISGLDGRISYLNPAGCARLGLSALKPGESYQTSSIKPSWSIAKLEAEIIPQALKHGSWTGEGAFLTPTGQEIPVSQVVIAHRSALGVTISTIARDISAARQAEQVLAEAGKFELTHGKVLDIFNASFDRKEILQGTLDALAENHPFPVSAVYLYDEWTGSLHREAARGVPENLARMFTMGQGLVGQAAQENKSILVDGLDPDNTLVIETGAFSLRPKVVLAMPIIYQERRQGVLVLASTRALTERERSFVDRLGGQLAVALHNLKLFDEMKLLSDQLRIRGEEINSKNRQLEEADRLKSEFLANMSHELRTPLNSIIGFSEVLLDGLRGELEPGQKQYVEQILDSGQHLLSLINDILDLSKVEAGRMELDLEPLEITTVLCDSLSIVLEKAGAHGVDLRCQPALDLGVLQADARKVKQILFNLLSNAVKFTPEGGAVRLLAQRMGGEQAARDLPNGMRTALPEQGATEFLEIEVTDTGLGIPAESLSRLFQPFSQLESGISRSHEGTGLGLAMVRKLAELHGGGVGVQSEEGKGSSFLVWLPYGLEQTRHSQPVPPGHRQQMKDERFRALVAGAFVDGAAPLLQVLKAEGLNAVRAASVEGALDFAREFKPHVMFLDVQPSPAEVKALLKRIQDLPALANIPVILLAPAAVAHLAKDLGASLVLAMPVSPEALGHALAAVGLGARGNAIPKVLVVDDDPKALEILSTLLEGRGFTVERAYGGREAIEIARRELFDLILLDLMMPEVSGFDVVEALKVRPDTAAIPILALTAKRLTNADRAKLNGLVARVMEKTEFKPETFIAEVYHALMQSRAGADRTGGGDPA
jgi:PAS domain S-box-containing protein